MDEPGVVAFPGAGGLAWRAGAADAEWVRAVLAPDPDGVARLPGAVEVKRNAVRSVHRVPRAGGAVYVKRFRAPGPLDLVKYLVRPSRAEAEWRASRGMRAAGLPVAEVFAVAEARRGPLLGVSMVALREVPDAADLVPYLFRRFPGSGPRSGADARARLDLLRRVGRLLRAIHDAGFVHPDLHGGNLLVGADEPPTLTVIDLHTVTRPGPPPPLRREEDLAKLLHSMRTATAAHDRARVIAAYEGGAPALPSGPPLPRTERALARMEAERIAGRTRRRRIFGASGRFDVHRSSGRRMVFLRRWTRAPFERALELHRRLDAEGGPDVLKRGGRSLVTRVRVETPDGERSVVVKETRVRGLADRWKNLLRPPRAVRAWIAGQGLWHRTVDVADPLALVVGGPLLFPRESILVMEDLLAAERLDLRLLRLYGGPLDAAARRSKRSEIGRAGRWLGDLHARGIYHGDLKAVNVFLREKHGDPSLCLVDYDRVVFGDAPVGLRRRVKNLAQLAASVGTHVGRADRLRFWRAYVDRFGPAAGDAREVGRAVAEACARKIVVVREPIE